MALFENLKKEQKDIRQTSKVPYLIVGQDWSSIKLYNFLREKFGRDQVLLLDDKEFHADYRFFPGPSLNRGEENQKVLKHFIQNFECSNLSEPMFYKDQKFRSFKGRARPLKIFEDEETFVSEGFVFDRNYLFTSEEEPSEVNFMQGTIESILENEDLRESESYKNNKIKVELLGGKEIICDRIFFAYSLNSLLRVVDKNTQLGAILHPYAKETFSRPAMVVEYSKLKSSETEGVFFIPQSQTHERGNFIVEASNIPGKHLVKCFAGVDREEFNEEELSKKIKLLKRTLERVFEDFNSADYEEKISCFNSSPLSQRCEFDAKVQNLITLIGPHGFVNESFFYEQNLEIDFQKLSQDAIALSTLEFIKTTV